MKNIDLGAPVFGRWSRRLNRWLDPEGPYHLERDDASPSCGAHYRSMEGPISGQRTRRECCRRCLAVYDRQVARAQCDPKCAGWLHMHDPREIQRCDACARFQTDEEARRAHQEECGCAWGPRVDGQVYTDTERPRPIEPMMSEWDEIFRK